MQAFFEIDVCSQGLNMLLNRKEASRGLFSKQIFYDCLFHDIQFAYFTIDIHEIGSLTQVADVDSFER